MVGANAPPEVMRRIRYLAGPRSVFLMPGIGAQGGSIRNALQSAVVSAEDPRIILCAGDSVVHALRGRGYEVAAKEAAAAYVRRIKKELAHLERTRT